jgi:hypothetical protein
MKTPTELGEMKHAGKRSAELVASEALNLLAHSVRRREAA